MKTMQNPTEEQLQSIIFQQKNTITSQEQQIAHLQEQLEWFKRQIFGKRSERIIPNAPEQQTLDFCLPENPEPATEVQSVATHKRRKPKRNGQDALTIPSNIPVETVFLDVADEEKVCKETGIALVKIGEEKSCKLAHKPGSFYIKETIRPKYAHPQRPEQGIVVADLPDAIIPKCKADNSLLAEIITKKFADHLPLYRIAEGMGRAGIGISHKLLSQWVVRLGLAIKPLYETMKQKVLQEENIFVDESPVSMFASKQCKKTYIWVMVGGSYRIYNFRENRCHKNASDMIKGYKKVLHSDKYGAYQKLAEEKVITWCPCYSHIRRKFYEAESGDPLFRKWILRKIRYLFMLEKVGWSRDSKERLRIRQEKELPIIDEMIDKVKKRLIKGKILPKSKFREALGYFCGLIPYLKNYTKHPFSRLDNNVAERAIRPLAIGRKNWMFFGSSNGGEAAAMLLSLVQTCRGLNINPQEYLEDIFSRLMSHSAHRLEELLPDQWLLSRQKSS